MLEYESEYKLETIVTNPEEFNSLLDRHLKNYTAGDELPLAKILGKDIRRLRVGAALLENQLISQIGSGDYTKMSVGKVAIFAGSVAPVQHFIVI